MRPRPWIRPSPRSGRTPCACAWWSPSASTRAGRPTARPRASRPSYRDRGLRGADACEPGQPSLRPQHPRPLEPRRRSSPSGPRPSRPRTVSRRRDRDPPGGVVSARTGRSRPAAHPRPPPPDPPPRARPRASPPSPRTRANGCARPSAWRPWCAPPRRVARPGPPRVDRSWPIRSRWSRFPLAWLPSGFGHGRPGCGGGVSRWSRTRPQIRRRHPRRRRPCRFRRSRAPFHLASLLASQLPSSCRQERERSWGMDPRGSIGCGCAMPVRASWEPARRRCAGAPGARGPRAPAALRCARGNPVPAGLPTAALRGLVALGAGGAGASPPRTSPCVLAAPWPRARRANLRSG